VLFAGSIGRTDLPGGDHLLLLKGLHSRLMTLEDSVRVYPGHGPETSIGRERKSNPFLNYFE
jgi:glyoxylase-like metal-dependent hydrolase (beta-lactamase superfamily II)